MPRRLALWCACVRASVVAASEARKVGGEGVGASTGRSNRADDYGCCCGDDRFQRILYGKSCNIDFFFDQIDHLPHI